LPDAEFWTAVLKTFGPDPRGRRLIVRFSGHKEYEQFCLALRKTDPDLRASSAIRTLPLIRSVALSSGNAETWAELPGVADVEEDDLVGVRAFPAAPTAVPWGVGRIRAPEAWRYSTGDFVKVGVIDTGVDASHPDLRGRIGLGVNLLNENMPPYDDNGHGTHIAGTIAAGGRPGGMAGVAPGAVVCPVKAFDQAGNAFVSDIVRGVEWCVRNGVDVINMSFGTNRRNRSLHAAVRFAVRAGVVVVCSAGNGGRRLKTDYPARYRETISVGAVDAAGRIARFSNRGADVDLYAPGKNIRSTWPGGLYYRLSGCSMATSHVSGVVALMLGCDRRLTPKLVKRLLLASAQPTAGASGRKSVDALRAVRLAMRGR